MRIETKNDYVILWGSMVGTCYDVNDQKEILKWFIKNKPKLLRECKRELKTINEIKRMEVPME